MPYHEAWRGIAARLNTLRDTGTLYGQLYGGGPKDRLGGHKFLTEQCQSVLVSIEEFAAAHKTTLPATAQAALDKFLAGRAKIVRTADPDVQTALFSLVLLTGFGSELSFLLSDSQEIIRARSELAFLHLKRSLAVDASLRHRWMEAFEGHETKCEALGAVHLLLHGIFAFKVDAAGGRTDLVFDEALEWETESRAAAGLVLTEWKLTNASNAIGRFDEAMKQAELYQGRAFTATELAGYRYLVAVSQEDLPVVPDDRQVGGVVYRHINIAIRPLQPSQRARKKS